MRRQESFNLFLFHAPRIHVLSRNDRFDLQKRLAFVFQCGRDWSLEEPIKREEILRRRRRSCLLVESDKIAVGRKRLLVSLVFVDALKNLSHFQQLSDSFALAVGQLRQLRRQTDRLGLVEYWLAFSKRPIADGHDITCPPSRFSLVLGD